ncbi:hypothetical protein [Salicibibacter halophilus]|nr:hypothetical protein [Salicibibacter halophilus]
MRDGLYEYEFQLESYENLNLKDEAFVVGEKIRKAALNGVSVIY